MMKLNTCILIIGICFSSSEGSTSIQAPSACNCGEDTDLICQVTGNIGSTSWYGLNRSIMINGIPIRPEDQNKYTETKGQSSFTLTIHNTDISDEGYYKCSNGFEESSLKRLNFECKASSATHSITSGKKVQITVDKLYPASPTFTVTFKRQNSAIQIPGSKTCSGSTRFIGFYICVWSSTNSLDDGSYIYSLVVTTFTQASPLTRSFQIVSPGSPLISNILQLNASREVLYGKEGQPLTMHCTSNGGYPLPTVTWYKNSITNSNQLNTTSSGTLQSDGTYTVSLQHTLTPVSLDDRKYYICRSYYPEADSAQIGSSSKFVLLYLTLKPSQPIVTQTAVVSAGNDVTVRCRTSGCRPAASLSWLYQGVKYNGRTTSTLDAATETYRVISTFNKLVTAADNGQNIQCIVKHPALTTPSQINVSFRLRVNYPPSVSINATNTTVKASSLILTCIARGVPDSNYRYGKWIQRWPGYDVPVSEKPGSETLELIDLTYEHSGYYACTASNGIKVVGTDTDFVEGTAAHLLVKSFPIIISLDDKIASSLNRNLTVTVDYFSNVPESNVKIYKNVNGVKIPTIFYSDTTTATDVELPVFSHLIKINGTKASFTIQIKSNKDFGYYIIFVSNEIGSSNKTFEVVMADSPETPSAFTIDYIQYNKARLTWVPGYNGGLEQTFVIQIGTDEKSWSDVEIYDGLKQDENHISTILTDLHDSTAYYVRMYAFNDNGKSKLSETLNFTTSPIEVKTSAETENTSAIIVGVVLGLLNFAQLVYGIYITVLLKRRRAHQKDGIPQQKSDQKYVNSDDTVNTTTKDERKMISVKSDGTNESQYACLEKDLREPESTYDAISAL